MHHTRKQPSTDTFDMIVGTNGLLDAVDGAMLLQKEKRRSIKSTLDTVGRDQLGETFYLVKNQKTLIWEVERSENDMDKEPQGLISAKTYKHKIVDPFVRKLKALIKTVLVRCLEGWDNYHRLNTTNRQLYRENDGLSKTNEKSAADNEVLRAENKDYKLLRKVIGKQLDTLVAQAGVNCALAIRKIKGRQANL